MTGYGAAPPRKREPPFRPLAPPAISRASYRRTRSPASASASAQEQPVIAAPDDSDVRRAIAHGARRHGSCGSSSQYDRVTLAAMRDA